MATARELGLRRGDIVRVGTSLYDMEPYVDIRGEKDMGYTIED